MVANSRMQMFPSYDNSIVTSNGQQPAVTPVLQPSMMFIHSLLLNFCINVKKIMRLIYSYAVCSFLGDISCCIWTLSAAEVHSKNVESTNQI